MMGPPCAWLESVKPWWRDGMLRHFDTVSERDRRTDRIPISISLVSIAVLTDDNKHCSVPTAGCCQLVIENNILPASCCPGQVINLVFSGPIPGKFVQHKYTNSALQKRSWPAACVTLASSSQWTIVINKFRASHCVYNSSQHWQMQWDDSCARWSGGKSKFCILYLKAKYLPTGASGKDLTAATASPMPTS